MGAATQPGQALSVSQTASGQQLSYRQGGLQQQPAFSTSMVVNTRHFTLPPKSSGVVEESLTAIQDSHRQETDHMLGLMKARLDEHQRNERMYEEQFLSLRTEYENLGQQLSAALAEIDRLRIGGGNIDPGSTLPLGELDSTVITTITAVTVTITTVITQIEQWRNNVAADTGRVTILGIDLDQLFSDLSDTVSQVTQLEQDYSELSKTSSSVQQQLELTLSLVKQKESAAASLTAKVTQLGRASVATTKQIATLREDNQKLRREITVYSSRITELEQNREVEVSSLRHELEFQKSLVEERDSTIVSVTAELAQLKQSEDEKTKEVATLRQDYAKLQRDSSSRIAELQKRYDMVSKEHDSALREVRDSQIVVAEKEHTITNLKAEVEKLKRIDDTKTERLSAERQETEKLHQDCAALSSQTSTLQERCDAQSKEIISLRSDIQIQVAQLAAQEHTITTVTTERESARRENEMQAKLIAAARQDAEELRQKLTVAWDEKAYLQKRFDSQLIELDKLREELAQIESIANMPPTGSFTDRHITQYITSALEKKKKELEKFRRDLVAATSRNNDLQKSQEALLSKVATLGDKLTVKTSQYEGTINALTIQVNQLKITCAGKTEKLADANNRVRELQLEVTTFTAQFTELRVRYDTQSKELISVSKERQTVMMASQDKDHEISSLISERDREKSANAAKAEQITKLQQQLTASGSELTKLQVDWKAQSEELVSMQSKLKMTISSNEEKERKVVTLTGEVAELKRVNTLGDERITVARKLVEELRLELTNSSSQITKLRYDFEMKSTELVSLRKRLEAAAGGEHATISSLTARVEEWMALCTAKGEELMAARKEHNETQHELQSVSSKYAQLQAELTSEIERLHKLDATHMAELATARTEIERLCRELETSSSQFVQLKQELASKAKESEELDAANATGYKAASSPSTEPREYEVQSHVQYGVICALPVDATDEDHIRRKHLWERDPTGDCYVPGYFESKLRMASFLSQLSCEMLTIRFLSLKRVLTIARRGSLGTHFRSSEVILQTLACKPCAFCATEAIYLTRNGWMKTNASLFLSPFRVLDLRRGISSVFFCVLYHSD